MRNGFTIEFKSYREGSKWEVIDKVYEITGREACDIAGRMTKSHKAKYRKTITDGEYRLRPIKVEAECNGK